jgi:L-ribulokinase
MQIYANVTNMEIKVSVHKQTSDLGAAMYGAVAAGSAAGGYYNIFEASKSMSKVEERAYTPNTRRAEIYNTLYIEYKKLYDYFGRGGNDVMKTLLGLKDSIDSLK